MGERIDQRLSMATNLDFSNNKFPNLSSLTSFIHRDMSNGKLPLEGVYMSNNEIEGDFPSDLYFPNTSLKILYLDQNRIGGVLDLSNWQSKMESLLSPSAEVADQLVLSLVNNSIVDISPDIMTLQPFIDRIRNASTFNRSGILLGGNPYCNGASLLQQRYLCRSSFGESYVITPKKGPEVAVIIAATLASIIVVALCVIFSIVILRLRKQVQSLREFQVELATKRVQPPFYSFEDLKVATRDFNEDNKLGSGAFGAVYKGELRDGSPVAVKLLFYDHKQDNPRLMDQFLNEVVLITGIKHKHLVQLQGCCIHGQKKLLVYEFAENGDLADALWGNRAKISQLNWEERRKICVGVARGLSYLHEELQPRIIHRDIKAANVLLDQSLSPKIADFGLAKPFQEEETQAQFTHIAGTRGYWAPEYVLDGQLTQKADVYSFGILVLEIVSGRPNFVRSLSEEEISLKSWAETLKDQERSLELLQPELRDDLRGDEVKTVIDTALLCLKLNPKERPTMSAVVFMLVEGRKMLKDLVADTTEDSDSQDSQFRPHILVPQTFRSEELDDVSSPLIPFSE